MKVGDLIRPIMRCSGDPGTIRCDAALVINFVMVTDVMDSKNTYGDGTVEILCIHGTSVRHHKYLEVIN